MNPLHPIFAIIIYGIAFISAYLINLKYKFTNDNERYENIDGLRGFLALGVFIHHSSIWYQYLQIESWEAPKSNVFNHLGQTSVSFFFMITAFLFISKLLNAKDKKIDWNTLFISRFFRLVPMYLTSIFVLVMIVLELSNWELKVPLRSFLKELFCWATFTLPGIPLINDYADTSIIGAGVVWSLPYEWLFYFSLPIFSLLILRKNPSKFYLFLSVLFVFAYFKIKTVYPEHLLSFAGGAITPFIIKYGSKKMKYNSLVVSCIVLLFLGLILFFETPDDFICKILIIIVFNLIVLGNTIFGILKSTTLKFLGEICYSTYLIHGIILFSVMHFWFGIEKAARLSPIAFCFTIFAITPIVVVLSFICYRNIEKPCMDFSKRIKIDFLKKNRPITLRK